MQLRPDPHACSGGGPRCRHHLSSRGVQDSSSSSSDASSFEADAQVGHRRAEGIARNPRPVHHRFPRWHHRVEMYIVQRGVRRGSTRWVCLQMLIAACLVVSVAACLVVSVAAVAGSIADVIGKLKEYWPFSG